MPAATKFRVATFHNDGPKPSRVEEVQFIQKQFPTCGQEYTHFWTIERFKRRDYSFPTNLIWRLVGDSIVMPVNRKFQDEAVDSADLKVADGSPCERTLFYFGARIGARWHCQLYRGMSDFIELQLREVKRTPSGELLYCLDVREENNRVSDATYWQEIIISRERGIVQLRSQAMLGRSLYIRED